MLRRSLILMTLLLSACATSPEDVQSLPPEPTKIDALEPYEGAYSQNYGEEDSFQVPLLQTEPMDRRETAQSPPKQLIKYPPLIYGAPKPLICSREYPAAGRLKHRPNLQLMWEHYLYERPERVWAEIGGVVEYNGCLPEDKGGWKNACTVRLSHMLNKAGHEIPYIKDQTVSGRNGDQYFFRLDNVQDYIFEKFGEPDIKIDMPGQLFDLPNTPGLFIIKFRGIDFTGHATIWNGAGTVDGVDIVGSETFFWELPCFIPAPRKAERNDENLSAVKIQKAD